MLPNFIFTICMQVETKFVKCYYQKTWLNADTSLQHLGTTNQLPIVPDFFFVFYSQAAEDKSRVFVKKKYGWCFFEARKTTSAYVFWNFESRRPCTQLNERQGQEHCQFQGHSKSPEIIVFQPFICTLIWNKLEKQLNLWKIEAHRNMQLRHVSY